MNTPDSDIFGFEEADKRYDQCLRSLGQSLVSFQQLESDLSFIVGFLCKPEDYEAGEIITAELPFKGLCNLASSMFKHWNPKEEDRDEFEKLLRRCFEIEKRRNQLIHSTYGMSGFFGHESVFQRSKITAKFKKGKKEAVEAISESQLSSFSVECTKLGCAIRDFENKIVKYWNEQ